MGGNVEQLITETKGGKAEGLQWGALHTAEHGVGDPAAANSQLPKSTTVSSLAWTLTILFHRN